MSITVRVPATTANLGPGFDCLGLALDLWNQVSFTPIPDGFQVELRGEGENYLPRGRRNPILRAALHLYAQVGAPAPKGLRVECDNHIPIGAGLGSSAAATLAGLLGANALLKGPLTEGQLLQLATEIEGHADNAAPALYGGLVVSIPLPPGNGGSPASPPEMLTYRVDAPPIPVVVVVPKFKLSTQEARLALPRQVPLADAIYNTGRTALVVEALRKNDLALLSQVMDDRLHQPYRLQLIPGARGAIAAALASGAAAAALSGAGPGIIAFTGEADPENISQAMVGAFQQAGLAARPYHLTSIPHGAMVSFD